MVSIEDLENRKESVAIVGLGYVGLPLAVALGKKFRVIGFDINSSRIAMLKDYRDPSRELSPEQLKSTVIQYTSDPTLLKEAKIIIVAVPTPIDHAKNPDLKPVLKACELIGSNMTKGTILVFESTVYPGVTDEVCGPALEKASGMKCYSDFKLGYSPERINPGDKKHTLEKILKIVSGQDEETLDIIAALYERVVEPGVHRAESIKVAEAAKVIENTQRDLNVALMNELSIIFNMMNIDTKSVLKAAGTKWNFLKFSPGLVGGHCIGVDPYYLTEKAKELGYNAEIILAGRRINDSMGKYVAENTIKSMISQDIRIKGAKVLVMGFTFKENVADIRNTRVIDIIRELEDFGVNVLTSDPHADPEEIREEYGLEVVPFESVKGMDAVVVATPHEKYSTLLPQDFVKIHAAGSRPILVDVKRMYDKNIFRK